MGLPTGEGDEKSNQTFGGLLQLFGFHREGESGSFQFEEESSFSPTFEDAVDDNYFADEDDWYAGDDEHHRVRVSWRECEARGRVETISNTMVAVAIKGDPPLHYERVAVVPGDETLAEELRMFGTVTRVKDGPLQAERTIIVRFTSVEEQRAGSFQEYVQAFHE